MGQDDPLTSDRSSARGLTKVWEELALEEEWAARLCGARVPINPKFGSGEKTRRELRVKALPDIELDDTDGTSVVQVVVSVPCMPAAAAESRRGERQGPMMK